MDLKRVLAIGVLTVVAGATFVGAAVNSRSFDGATGWLNTQAASTPELRGKVVLVDFWTYSCINWRRTLPYLRAWSEKYRDQGLVVVGVHTPEFAFEKDIRNVSVAVKEMRVEYPVALDSDYRIWRAYDNRYWPALYLVDAKGRVRYFHAGEGDYDGAERAIQQALEESGAAGVARDLVAIEGSGVEAPPNIAQLKTPETYIGYGRAERKQAGRAPANLPLNAWALSGGWTVAPEFAVGNAPGDALAFAFHARDVYLVMGRAAGQTGPVRFRLRLDGHKPGADHGGDVDGNGDGTVIEPRMYHLIRQAGPITDRRVDIEFLDIGVQAYVFTFG